VIGNSSRTNAHGKHMTIRKRRTRSSLFSVVLIGNTVIYCTLMMVGTLNRWYTRKCVFKSYRKMQ